jgi:hypothetical protein
MAKTYEPIATNTLSSGATSMTIQNIPATYTDLKVVISGLVYYASAGTYLTGGFQVGSSNTIDTTASYSATTMYADTSAVGSSRLDGAAGTSVKYALDIMAASTDTGARSISIIDIINYANTTTYKSMIVRTNTVQTATATNMLRQAVATWRNTGAINTIKFLNLDGTNFYAGSTMTVYGIKAA